MRALDRKVLRDVSRLRGQLVAIGAVLAAGVGLFLTMRICLRSMETAQADYYARERFGHVFSGLVRAPEFVADELRSLPGVQRVQTRVVASVTVDLPDIVEAVQGRLVSIPDRGEAEVNALRLRSGRLPEPDRAGEAVVAERFAEAHGLRLGDSLRVIIDGHQQSLRMVGTAISPEFVYTLGPGMLVPDDRLYGVIFLRRGVLGPAYDMDGAFNDVSLQIAPSARREEVVARVDSVLDRHGGSGAYARKDHPSHFFLHSEFTQLRTIGSMVPGLFLLAGAFLLNVVVGRILTQQRPQIAALKALGYRDREIASHFAKLVGVVVVGGLLLGAAVAGVLGAWMLDLYGRYYRLPDLEFRVGATELAQTVLITGGAAALGTWAAIRRTVRLPPAEAMRAAPPANYRRTVLERLGLRRFVSPSTAMTVREMERRPLRRFFVVVGMAVATSLVVVSTFFLDAIDEAMHSTFLLQRREDVQLQLTHARATGSLRELEHLPGVVRAEPFRTVPVRIRNGPRHRNTSILGLPADARLHRVLDENLEAVSLPSDGLVLSSRLAHILDARVGDRLRFEVLEGHRPQLEVAVSRVVRTDVGLSAFMELNALCRVLRETPSLNGAWLEMDASRLPELHARVKEMPTIAGIASRDDALIRYQQVLAENLGTSIGLNIAFSLIMALGILYNAARIGLAEQARNLASLRVLGFRRREVAAMLLGELALLTVVSIPIGLLLGRGLAYLAVLGLDSDQLRIPLLISSRTDAIAILTILFAAALSGWSAWRRLDRMDIIEVLKTSE